MHNWLSNLATYSRFRVCQLLAKLLSGADEGVGSQRLDKIQRAMLVRLHDKVGGEKET